MTNRFSRRDIVKTAVSVAGTLGASSALANNPLDLILQNRSRAQWDDGFDTGTTTKKAVRSPEPALSPRARDYISVAIEQHQRIAALGGWPTVPEGPRLQIGMRHNAVAALRARLQTTGDMVDRAGDSKTFDTYVDNGVRRFQLRHGLVADGKVGRLTYDALNVSVSDRLMQLQANYDRVETYIEKLPKRFAAVNIPAAEIEAVDNGLVSNRHTAVVGKVDRPTPILNSKIFELNFNPYWHVPESIVRRDLIPIMQRNPKYLDEHNIRIYDSEGNELSAEFINWQSDEATAYLFRQDPGEINSLGSIRINFPNKESVYLHDTPSKNLFGENQRFHSSGCVRVQNVRQFATWLLNSDIEWSRAAVDATIRSRERLDVKLEKPVELRMVYVSAWSSPNGIVNFREDVYGLDQPGYIAPEPT